MPALYILLKPCSVCLIDDCVWYSLYALAWCFINLFRVPLTPLPSIPLTPRSGIPLMP